MANANRYYSLLTSGRTAEIDIYGYITKYPDREYGDVSSYDLSSRIKDLDVDVIYVNINSYGGEVSEGLAIASMLRRHSARIVTRCDGFACSIASVIFAAGDDRIMSDASLLMIHNAWLDASGDANFLRKIADDCEKVTEASVKAYMRIVNVSESELRAMMDDETWISPDEALEMGFATYVDHVMTSNFEQSARRAVYNAVRNAGASIRQEHEEEVTDETGDDVGADDPTAELDEQDEGDADEQGEHDEPENQDEQDDQGKPDDQDEPRQDFLTRFFTAIM